MFGKILLCFLVLFWAGIEAATYPKVGLNEVQGDPITYKYALSSDGSTPIIVSASGVITQANVGKGSDTQKVTRTYARHLGKPDDTAGHILAKQLGGPGHEPTNIVPQCSYWNSGMYNQFENVIRKCLDRNPSATAKLDWVFFYENPALPNRPSRIDYKVKFSTDDCTSGYRCFCNDNEISASKCDVYQSCEFGVSDKHSITEAEEVEEAAHFIRANAARAFAAPQNNAPVLGANQIGPITYYYDLSPNGKTPVIRNASGILTSDDFYGGTKTSDSTRKYAQSLGITTPTKDTAGHIRAKSLGGPGHLKVNIFPQSGVWNGGPFAQFEQDIKRCLSTPKSSGLLEWYFFYDDPVHLTRPSRVDYRVTYTQSNCKSTHRCFCNDDSINPKSGQCSVFESCQFGVQAVEDNEEAFDLDEDNFEIEDEEEDFPSLMTMSASPNLGNPVVGTNLLGEITYIYNIVEGSDIPVVKRAFGTITKDDLDTGTKSTKGTSKYAKSLGYPFDTAGHILARQLGGPGNQKINIFPQSQYWNGVVYNQFENDLRGCLEDDPEGQVYVEWYFFYHDSNYPTRPTRVDYQAKFSPSGCRTVFQCFCNEDKIKKETCPFYDNCQFGIESPEGSESEHPPGPRAFLAAAPVSSSSSFAPVAGVNREGPIAYVYEPSSDGKHVIVTRASGTITRDNLFSGTSVSTPAKQYVNEIGISGDTAGHILAKQLGGKGNKPVNLFPQSALWNQRAYNRFENYIKNCLQQSRDSSASLEWVFFYGSNPTRPYRVDYQASFSDNTKCNTTAKCFCNDDSITEPQCPYYQSCVFGQNTSPILGVTRSFSLPQAIEDLENFGVNVLDSKPNNGSSFSIPEPIARLILDYTGVNINALAAADQLDPYSTTFIAVVAVEQVMTLIFENRKDNYSFLFKEVITVLLSLYLCFAAKLDLVQQAIGADSASLLGYVFTALVIAGAAKIPHRVLEFVGLRKGRSKSVQAIQESAKFRPDRTRVLSVAVEKYPTNPLTGCLNDSDLIVNFFRDRGVKSVDQLLDPNSKAFTDKLRVFANNAKRGDVLVLHYSGHGSHVGGEEVLCPVDFNPEQRIMISDSTLANIFKDTLAKGVTVIFLMDCCFSGGLFQPGEGNGNIRSFPTDITEHKEDALLQLLAAATTKVSQCCSILLSACKSNELASEFVNQTKEYGLFTFSLVSVLNERISTYDDVFERLSNRMKNLSQAVQTPVLLPAIAKPYEFFAPVAVLL